MAAAGFNFEDIQTRMDATSGNSLGDFLGGSPTLEQSGGFMSGNVVVNVPSGGSSVDSTQRGEFDQALGLGSTGLTTEKLLLTSGLLIAIALIAGAIVKK